MSYCIDTDAQLSMLGDELQGQIDLLSDYRKELYRQRRDGGDINAELADVNRKLRAARRELTICRHVTEDIPRIRDQEQLMREQAQPSKNAARERAGENARKEQKGKWM